MELQTYFNRLRNKKVLVLGLGISNRPLVRLLLHYGISVTGCDKTKREDLDAEVLELEKLGCRLHLGDDYLENISGDVAFRTPGLHPNKPELVKLRNSGCKMTSEMEAFFQVCPCRIIGVTGSDGKTTTSTLISEMLKHAGRNVWLGGNIGTPLLDKSDQMKPEDLVVLELSSFQLMDLRFSPHIAVITNLAPNHLDIHKDMAEYVEAKTHVFTAQNQSDILILNRDNEITRNFAPHAKGTVKFFSRQEEADVCFRDDKVFCRGREILKRSDILIPGLHNVENYMAAIAAVEGLVSDDDIRYVARNFGGVEHRIELVRVKDGVRFYNDSIASSPSRTIAGLRSFQQKVILIAGGYDKCIPFDSLGEEIVRSVKLLVCTGTTGGKIAAATRAAGGDKAPEILMIDDFYEAVRTAASRAASGDVVILSPAGPAFDKFKNFMVRGAEFKKTVMEL